MSNRFSCVLRNRGDFYQDWDYNGRFLSQTNHVYVDAHYFFYCAQPLATSASIQNVRTNLREYYVKRIKIGYMFNNNTFDLNCYLKVFVLNVPEDYTPSKTALRFKLTDLPNYTIPENVLYYGYIKPEITDLGGQYRHSKNVTIDIKKRFKVSPGYKLAFVSYTFANEGNNYAKEGNVEVFFEVN